MRQLINPRVLIGHLESVIILIEEASYKDDSHLEFVYGKVTEMCLVISQMKEPNRNGEGEAVLRRIINVITSEIES